MTAIKGSAMAVQWQFKPTAVITGRLGMGMAVFGLPLPIFQRRPNGSNGAEPDPIRGRKKL